MAVLTIWRGNTMTTLDFVNPQPLRVLLESAGFHEQQLCGGRGICGKCAVELHGMVSEPNDAERRAGTRLLCQAEVLGDAEVILTDETAFAQIQTASQLETVVGAPMNGKIGAAVDIGTTTIALRRYDLLTGELLGESAMENPQRSVAADVMGRIGAALDGQLDKLSQQVRDAIGALLAQAGGSVDAMVIAGNTTMLYLLTGRNPACLSCVPFEADTLFDTEISLLESQAYLPPCMNAFVGADITCAVLASNMCADKVSLLCDIGTNGEIALWKDDILYVTATAAGPAFEGAGISCGCSSVTGAIDKAWIEQGQLCIHTIADAPAVGLCGSGLIDTVAQLLELEVLDETGALDDDEVELAPGVILLQKDIRALQLAKAAIAAGIETLLEVSSTDPKEIENFYIAGGFGSHLDIQSAVKIGLIPVKLADKVRVIGNAALVGASQLLLDQRKVELVQQIAKVSCHKNLGGDPLFNELYVEQMFFPVDD